jgi:endoglucanase
VNRTNAGTSGTVRRLGLATFVAITLFAGGLIPAHSASSTSQFAIDVPSGTYIARFSTGGIQPGARVQILQGAVGSTDQDRVAEYLIGSTVPSTLTALIQVTGPSQALTVSSTNGASGAPTLTPADGASGLIAQGTGIIDVARNQRVRFRGLTMNNFVMSKYGDPAVNSTQVRWVRQKGANYVRVPLAQIYLTQGSYYYDAGYLTRVKNFTDLLQSKGITPMISLMVSNLGDSHYYPGKYSPPDQVMPDDGAVTFWQKVATAFKDRPKVMFELFNEPKLKLSDDNERIWRVGGTVYGGGHYFHTPGIQALVDAIRGTGAYNLVAAMGLWWGGSLHVIENNPLSGTNIIYTGHAYGGDASATTYPSTMDSALLPYWDQNGSWRYAGFLDEFGTTASDTVTNKNQASRYLQSIITWCENHGIGWAAYGWFPDRKSDLFGLLKGWNADGPALTSMAKTVSNSWWG